MRIRRVAVLLDGGFFLKRLPKVVESRFRETPEAVAETARILCKRHVQRLIGEAEGTTSSRWLDHVYRLFYYDARPYDGIAHHPIANRRIEFAKTEQARFRESLFQELRQKRKFALRLGKVAKEGDWQIPSRLTKTLIKTRELVPILESLMLNGSEGGGLSDLTEEQRRNLEKLIAAWKGFGEDDVSLILRQKGVDMRIGLDIASMTLKKQADTIILVTGDSDFVPAAKLARREGVEFILDPMWQNVNDDLFEHIDGLVSVLRTGNRSDTSEERPDGPQEC
ncbi:MAG: NYN domain-containing protein [Nitrospirae bacterium]|nr:NYN domain-containing protein [Magnetococcales bacterium]HAT48961.1 NYN domain-containing protein [Alphaproteobacteria bacterium]